jgi:hypothetical protein
MYSRKIWVVFGLGGVIFILACAPLSASVPTSDPNLIHTLIAETAGAAASQTAALEIPTLAPTSTDTPPPTSTPTGTPSPTPTFLFILPTPTVPTATPEVGSSGKALDCVVVRMEPADNSHIAPRKDFTMIWTVRNNGTEAWDGNSMDYRYQSGTKLHLVEAYDMETSPVPGEEAGLRVAMRSPDAAGSYTTTWAIRLGRTVICRMSVTILVP